jgi:hypothetical protein
VMKSSTGCATEWIRMMELHTVQAMFSDDTKSATEKSLLHTDPLCRLVFCTLQGMSRLSAHSWAPCEEKKKKKKTTNL